MFTAVKEIFADMFEEKPVLTKAQFERWQRDLHEYLDQYDEKRGKYRWEFDSAGLTPHYESYEDYYETTVRVNDDIRRDRIRWKKRLRMFQQVSGIILICFGLLGFAQMTTGNTIVKWTVTDANLAFLYVWAYVRFLAFPSCIVGGIYYLMGKRKFDRFMERVLQL